MPPKKPVGGEYAPFVSCELNDDEKSFVRDHLLTGAKVLEMLSNFVENGYRTSLTYDLRNDAVSIIVTGVGDGCPNKGLALSGRGPTVQGACTVLAYKHSEKLHEVWPKPSGEKKRDTWG
jgi:hypothetical protein